jgi:hypothetical protein
LELEDEVNKYQWLLRLGRALCEEGFNEIREMYDIIGDGRAG